VLTLRCLRSATAARYGAAATLSLIISGVILSAAYADGMLVGGCVRSRGAVNCVARWGEAGDPYIRLVPDPADALAKKRSAERDRRWEERCRPLIAQDRYGVPRYHYAASGCEFGVIE
jgi:hypothetical protein